MDSPSWTQVLINDSRYMVSVDLLETTAFGRMQAGLSVFGLCKDFIMYHPLDIVDPVLRTL